MVKSCLPLGPQACTAMGITMATTSPRMATTRFGTVFSTCLIDLILISLLVHLN